MAADRFAQVLDRIDQLNREDPTTERAGGTAVPRELLYAQRLTDWVRRLAPDASEALQIAARGQHVQRWTIPRERYPRGRAGYLKWRETLKAFHAKTVAGLMREAGYPEDAIQQVERIMSKRHLADDADSQTLEDALCLVFLETQFAALRAKTPDEKMREVLQKTWQKMSPRARSEALQLPLGEGERCLLSEALR
ncbi:MAG: DUF4202 domain-containing protein [Candidatus Omnitrophica bacterium]|nr:DUF4202 domain-containing protein [Candidatus Omnitrophota bacterium]